VNQRIPVAVVGTGHMGRHHVRIYSELPEADLVGIVDTDEVVRLLEMDIELNAQGLGVWLDRQ